MVPTTTARYTPVVYRVVYQSSLQKAGKMLMLSARDHTSSLYVVNGVFPPKVFLRCRIEALGELKLRRENWRQMMPRKFAPKLGDLYLSRKSGPPERRLGGGRKADETALHDPYGTFVSTF